MVQQEKAKKVSDFTEMFENANLFYLINFSSLSVSQITVLRQRVREAEGNCKITKKSFALLALKKSNRERVLPYLKDLTGVIGFVFGEGANGQKLAKILTNFEKEFEPFRVKIGYYDGNLLSSKQVSSLAGLPSRNLILADLIGGLNFPLTGFLNFIQTPIRNFVSVLKNIEKKQTTTKSRKLEDTKIETTDKHG